MEHYKNIAVNVNGKILMADSFTINQNAAITPVYLDGNRYSFYNTTQDNIATSLKFTHYLTGEDPFKKYWFQDDLLLTGSFGKFSFLSGYLKNHSIQLNPNAPVQLSTEIIVFDSIERNNNLPSYVPAISTPLSFSDTTITQTNNTENIGNIFNGAINYEASIKPYYNIIGASGIRNLTPSRVCIEEKTITCELNIDSDSGHLFIDGEDLNIQFGMVNPLVPSLSETYTLSGAVVQRTLALNQNSLLTNTIQIRQNNLTRYPTISSINLARPSLYPGDSIIINGTNLETLQSITIDGRAVKAFKTIDKNSALATIDSYNTSGILKLTTYDGAVSYGSNIPISYSPIIINSVSPEYSQNPNNITIQGTSFYDISKVQIGNKTGSFKVVSPQKIQVQVPASGSNGPIWVTSAKRGISGGFSGFSGYSGSSVNDFFYPPIITSFDPRSGIAGDTIKVTGINFSGLDSYIYINNRAASYTQTDTGSLTFTIPNGDVRGLLKLSNQRGQVGYSSYSFSPYVKITGNTPYVVKTDDVLRISGLNFQSSYFYPYGTDVFGTSYQVYIGGTITGFYISSNILLTGKIPSTANTGPIYLIGSDGGINYASSGSIYKTLDAPIINEVFPTGFISGDSLKFSLQGSYLNQVTRILFTGNDSGAASGCGIEIWPEVTSVSQANNRYRTLSGDLSIDLLGKRVNFEHSFNNPTSVTHNAFLTGIVGSGALYNVWVVNSGGTGIWTGILNINPLINLCKKSQTSFTTSGYDSTHSYHNLIDGVTGGTAINDAFFITTAAKTPSLVMNLGQVSQIHRIDIYPRTDSNFLSNSGTITGYLEIQLWKTGIIQQSGYNAIQQGKQFISGYGINTNTQSWRYEADRIVFIAHKKSAGLEQTTAKLCLSELEVYGIY